MKKIVTSAFATLVLTVQAQNPHPNISYPYDGAAAMRDHCLDFERMRLYVEFEPQNAKVKGKVTHFFSPIRQDVDSFYLDGPGIDIKSAQFNGKDIKYKIDADGISFFTDRKLKLGEKDSLVIAYEANPRKGIYFIGWSDPNNLSRKQIWTQGQGIDNRHWFPCYDTPNDKLITEVIVKFDKAYKVLSNGVKVLEKEQKDGTKLWHYKMSKPHASYLLMLGIGMYDIKETRSKSGVPLRQWYYPEWKDRYEYTYKYNEKIFDFLESEIGVPYGWESYSQIPVQDFMFGAMENTSATLFGDFFEVDGRSFNDRNYVSVNAHELAHQWFGDYVTARSGTSHWLQESFATHYNYMAEKECFGQDHFDWARRQAFNSAIAVQDKKPIAHTGANSTIIYQKGSMVLEMLKYVVGREAFNRSIKRYLLDHKYANVDSDDLLSAFMDELGMPLEWFWHQWVFRGSEPSYQVDFADITTDGKRFSQFVVKQTHMQNDIVGLFKMPIAFEVHYKDGSVDSKKEWIEKESHVVKVPNTANKEVDFVLFDPNSEVIKTVGFKKSFEMLRSQSIKAPKMIDRYDAVYAMRSFPLEQKRKALLEAFQSNTFHAIRAEIVSQLIDDTHSESVELIKKALNDKDVQVRKSVVMNARMIPQAYLSDFEKMLTDSSYITILNALEKLSIQYPQNLQKYLEITKDIEGTNGRNVRMKWLEIAASNLNDQKSLDKLVEYTSNSYEFITRTNAMGALKRLNYFNETALVNCLEASISNNGRLAGPAAETVKYFYGQNRFKKMIYMMIMNKASKPWEKEVMMKLMQ